MAQFDVFRNQGGGEFALLLDLQTPMLAALETRVVVPLATLKRYGSRPISRLNPIAKIGNIDYVLVFQELAAVSIRELGSLVGSLAERRTELLAALDLLITGV